MLLEIATHFVMLATVALGQMTPTEVYSHSATLRSGNVKLYWRFDEIYITIEVMGRTTGWLGIGFSPNGAMDGADIIIGWVKNGKVTITDRHGTGNVVPTLDTEQNIRVLGGAESDGWTMLKFSRQLAACEPFHDREITTATERLIYAFGTDDPAEEDIVEANYHGRTNRGVESIYFLEPAGVQYDLPVGPTYQSFDIVANNFEIPAEETYYNCRLYKLPELSQKHHIVKVEPVISPGNEEFVHHILIYQCGDVLKNTTELGIDVRCYTPNMEFFRECTSLIGIWAIGSRGETYPEDAGLSIGGPGGPVFVQIETHYDNPFKKAGIRDNSGLRYTYTSTTRRYDIGVLTVGANINGLEHLIPPQASDFLSTSYCTAKCLENRMDDDGVDSVKIIGVGLHTHLAGRRLRLRHIRNGTELPNIVSDPNYDFNYQYFRFLDPYVILEKHDTLQMECVYNTADRNVISQGGLGTTDEMCLGFILHYPKIDLPFCYSSVSRRLIYPYFGISGSDIESFGENRNPQNLLSYRITAPKTLAGITLFEYFSEYNWTAQSVKEFEKFYQNAKHYQVCLPRNRNLKMFFEFDPVSIDSPYVEPRKECFIQATTSMQTNTSTTTPMQTTSSSSKVKKEPLGTLLIMLICISMLE